MVFAYIIDFMEKATGYDSLWLVKLSHMLFRALIIYLFGITLARFNKKFLGIRTPFNFILFVMLGSVSANAIAIEALFLPTLGILLFLTLLNGLITWLVFYFPRLEFLIKGKDSLLIKNGKIQWGAMRDNLITERELRNELRAHLHTNDLQYVDSATLASDGTISFILHKKRIKMG